MRRHLVVLLTIPGLLTCSKMVQADGPTPSQLQALLASGAVANQSIQAQGGNASNAVVTAFGSAGSGIATVPRSLAARFGAVIDERDYGAQCNGSADDTAAFRAAQLAAQAQGGATIRLDGPGTCNLQTVYTVSNNGWEFGANLHLNGTVSGVLDDVSHARRTIAFQSGNDVGESNLFLSQEDEASSGTAAYQKNGVYVRLFQDDPSTYTGTVNNVDQVAPNKDAVAYEAQIDIRPGTMAGRIYGYHAQASAETASDGNINVGEFELSNDGSYTPQAGRFNSKRVLHLTCVGTVDCTEGLELDGASRFHAALDSFQSAIRTDGYFLYLGTASSADLTASPVFGVSQSGQITTSGGAAITGGLSADRLTVSGLTTRSASNGAAAAAIATPASGAAPSGATQLASSVIRVTSCGSGTALQLPAGTATGSSTEILLLNRSGAACTVYPPSGGTIESGAVNAPVTVPSAADQAFRSLGPAAWYE